MNNNHVIALVGMTGSGKSEVSTVFEQIGYQTLRFGDVTEKALRAQGLDVNEENERRFREEIRHKLGMAAYAILNVPEIKKMLNNGNVAADGLYSWEEYLAMKEEFGNQLKIVHVHASPSTRYTRLGSRTIRPLTLEQAKSRDKAEIENLNKGGPIAMADYVIVNDAGIEELEKNAKKIAEKIRKQLER